jgi:hypothetical protein
VADLVYRLGGSTSDVFFTYARFGSCSAFTCFVARLVFVVDATSMLDI